jgi:glycosyltransferase involved in cell wall biosynthesis
VADVRDVLPQGLRAGLVRFALRFSADELVFNSRFTQASFGPTRPATATVSYPSVDLRRFLDVPYKARQTDEAPVLGIVGQITPWKGQDDGIRILAGTRQCFPGTRLRVIGRPIFSGPGVSFDNEAFAHALRALAHELGVSDAVEFTGEIEDLAPIYESLDVLLVPSWQEPFGRVVAEGMAAGVPVVATSVGGPAELIVDGESGLLAPPRSPDAWVEPICRLFEDPELARRLATGGRDRISNLLRLERDTAEPPVEDKSFAPASASPTTG